MRSSTPQGGALTDLTAKLVAAAGLDTSSIPYYGWASDINAGGTVIGTIGQIDDPSPFQYAGGKFTGAPGSYAGKINDNGVIANIYFDPASAAVMVTRGGTTFTIEPTDVGGINNLDQVVGYSWPDERSYLYEAGGEVKLFGPTGAEPKDINNQGIIVGQLGRHTWWTGDDDRAFVIRNGVVTDLNMLVTLPPGAVLTEAVGINDKGQIAVNGLQAGRQVAFLLTPSAASGSIAGRVFNDANRNGVRNAGEPGLSNRRVYIDANKNGAWDIGEQITQTNATGDYTLTNLPAGTFRVNEIPQDGWARIHPPGSSPLEHFDVTLTKGQRVTGRDFGNVAIPFLSVASVATAEGNAGTSFLKFTVRLSAASADSVTVKYGTGNATSQAPGDYAKRFGTLTFAPGETAKTVSVAVNGDAAVEADERFSFVLYSPAGATIAKARAFGTIRNDDHYPAVNPGISVGDANTVEGDGRTHAVSFTVSLDRPTSKTVGVRYATADGTAKVSDNDYQPASGTLTFRPGQRTRTVSVLITGDNHPDGDEFFRLLLSSPVNGSVTRAVGRGTLLNDDPLGLLRRPHGSGEGVR